MSHTFLWEPAKRGKMLPTPASSAFREAMEDVFGPFPATLGDKQFPLLEAMAAVYAEREEKKNPYRVLASAINEHGTIRVWIE